MPKEHSVVEESSSKLRDEARQFLQGLNCFCNDQIVDRDVESDLDAVLARFKSERERCAKIVQNVRPGVPRSRIVELIHDGNHNPPDEVIR